MLLTLLVPFLAPQGPALTAAVTDPLSHGTVGDSLLSLDEALRVARGTLTNGNLSAAEQACITGPGGHVEVILVDGATTPTITVQGTLSDIAGVPGIHQHVAIQGMPTPAGALPVIQGGSVPVLFNFRSYGASLHELHVVGGQVAVDARMPQPTAPVAHMAEVMGCRFEGQTVAAIHVHGTGLDESMVMAEDSEFTNLPLAFWIEDATTGGMVMIEGEHVHMDGVQLGCRVDAGGQGANMSMFNLFRSTFTNGAMLAQQRRPVGSTQQFMFRIVHSAVQCTGDVLDVEGNATALTMVHHHHSDFTAGAGRYAFRVWPRTAQFDVHGSEMEFTGDVSITGNLASPRIWQQNCRYHGGTVTLDVDGALPNLLWNQYENCTLNVPSTARSPVAVRNSELVNTSITGQSFLAPVSLQGCWRSGGTMAGFASDNTPAPAAFLGTTTVTPAEPQVGTSITLATDLPFGIGLVWDIAVAIPRPTTTLEPVRFYGDPTTAIVLPALVMFQSQLVVPIPNTPSLAGLEFYAQGIALPLLGQTYAPAYHLPRGQLLLLQP